MKARRFNAVAPALALLAGNTIAYLMDLPLLVLNVACVLAFGFFTLSQSPKTFLGFALTIRDWGDIIRREMGQDGAVAAVTAADTRRAATKSLAILSAFVLLGLCRELFLRDIGARAFMQAMSILIGMESGFVTGYLVAVRRRTSSISARETRRGS